MSMSILPLDDLHQNNVMIVMARSRDAISTLQRERGAQKCAGENLVLVNKKKAAKVRGVCK